MEKIFDEDKVNISDFSDFVTKTNNINSLNFDDGNPEELKEKYDEEFTVKKFIYNFKTKCNSLCTKRIARITNEEIGNVRELVADYSNQVNNYKETNEYFFNKISSLSEENKFFENLILRYDNRKAKLGVVKGTFIQSLLYMFAIAFFAIIYFRAIDLQVNSIEFWKIKFNSTVVITIVGVLFLLVCFVYSMSLNKKTLFIIEQCSNAEKNHFYIRHIIHLVAGIVCIVGLYFICNLYGVTDIFLFAKNSNKTLIWIIDLIICVLVYLEIIVLQINFINVCKTYKKFLLNFLTAIIPGLITLMIQIDVSNINLIFTNDYLIFIAVIMLAISNVINFFLILSWSKKDLEFMAYRNRWFVVIFNFLLFALSCYNGYYLIRYSKINILTIPKTIIGLF